MMRSKIKSKLSMILLKKMLNNREKNKNYSQILTTKMGKVLSNGQTLKKYRFKMKRKFPRRIKKLK